MYGQATVVTRERLADLAEHRKWRKTGAPGFTPICELPALKLE